MGWHIELRGAFAALCLRHLHQRDQLGADESNTPVQPEKLFCGELQLQLSIPSCIDNISFVGAVINAACLTLSFSSQEANQIELCVLEAVVNAMKHAYASHPGHVVEICVSTQAGRLIIQVYDYGQAMTRKIPTALDFDPHDITQVPEGGMGLVLIHSLMDEVSYVSNQGANVLTMTRRMST